MGTARKIFLYVIYFVVVILLGGFIVMSARSKTPAPSKSISSSRTAGSSITKSGGNVGATSTSPKPTPTPAAADNQASLVNTGPGNVIGLFVVTSIVGTLLYRHKLIDKTPSRS